MSQPQIINIPEISKDFFACRVVLATNHQYPGNIQRFFRLQNCLGRKSSISRKNSKTYWPAELSQPQVISIPERFKDFFARRIVPSANHQYPGNIQRLFCLQKCLSRKSSISRKYPKTSSPAELSQPQIINIPEISKDFFACRVVLAANHQNPGNIQRLFCLQKFLRRKSSISRKYPKTSSPPELCQQQIINTPEIFKDFFACRIVSAANHQYPEKTQRLIGLQNCLSRKSSVSRKDSKTFSPADLSHQQIINIPEISKDVFACRIVSTSNYLYPGNIQRLLRLQNCLSSKSSVSRNIQRLFRLQSCLSRKSSISGNYSKTFFACRLVVAANHQYSGNIQRLFRLQNSTRSKSSKSRNYLKIFSPADLSQLQIVSIPKILKVFFACRIVLAANHQYPGNIQRFFRLQNFLGRKSSISRKNSKTYWPAELSQSQVISIPERFKDFFARRIVPSANHQYPGNIQRLFCLQKCLSRKSSISRKYPKTSSPAELSQQQIINTPEIFKYLFACRIVSDANHQYPEKTQRLIGLQNCLSRKSSVSRKNSKTFSPAELSHQQIINIAEIFKDFFACRNVLAANHRYPGNIQRLLRLQSCLSSKSSIPRKYSKTFLPAELSQPQIINIPEISKDFFACRVVLAANHQNPGNIQRLFCLQKFLRRKSSISRKYPKTSSPADLSQQQIINTPEIFKDFFACRIVSAANHQYPEKTQRLIGLQNCLSRKSSVSRKDSKTFSPAELSHQQIVNIPKKLKDLLACRVVLAENHQYPRTIQKLFLPVELSQPQITNIPELFKGFFACRIVLGASHQNPGIN